MKKNISQRYFSIIGKNLSDVSDIEAHDTAMSFVPQDDAELVSLITLLSFFDNKNDLEHVSQNNTLAEIGNLRSLIRDMFRESRKTRRYPINTSKVLMDKYYEAFGIIVEMLEEIHNTKVFDALINNKDKNADLIALINELSDRVNDVTFPLRTTSLSNAKDVFSKGSSDNQWVREIFRVNQGSEQDHLTVHPIEIILFIEDKRRNGLSFDDILEFNDTGIFKDNSFVYSVLFIYNKTPYDLLKSKSSWLRNTAMKIMTA